ncbi:MAG: glycosyltransferase family 4 protein [Patescibacteria group bacterium]|nr:glycosyltransferase family 4 protein [Patescibacteria group bacterium]
MKLKVLEIIGDATLAGAPRHLLTLLENFDYKKFEIFVICPPGPLAGEIKTLKESVNLYIVPMHSRFDLKAIKEIRLNIKHIKPNLIHVHGTRAGLLGRLAAIGLKFPLIYTEHLWTRDYHLSSHLENILQITGLWFLDMFTDQNIAVSQAVKDFMVESQVSRAEKITVIYNAISPSKKKAKIFSGKDVTLGTVGTLNLQKGIQHLISAMPKIIKEFPKTKLVIVGEGFYKDHLKELVRKMKLSRSVTFTGFAKDIEEEMINFDIYVQPSISESFGLAIVQAMDLGLPVVATNTGGIPEVVTTGKTGLLVEAASPSALTSAILTLLRDQEKAKEMGKLGAEEAKIRFNLKDLIEETEGIYEKVAQNRA